MQYSKACGEEISKLAFGTMRLPLKEDGDIDQGQVNAMTDYAMEHGVNYYDTAYPYHDGRFTFDVLKEEYGIYAIRGPRGIPNSLSAALK